MQSDMSLKLRQLLFLAAGHDMRGRKKEAAAEYRQAADIAFASAVETGLGGQDSELRSLRACEAVLYCMRGHDLANACVMAREFLSSPVPLTAEIRSCFEDVLRRYGGIS